MKRNFFESLIAGNQISPPEKVIKNLMLRFTEAINIEWYKKGQYFEAIFYSHQIEHIARFNPDGEIEEFKVNIPESQIPPLIVSQMHAIGEIMSTVVINRPSEKHYEIIVRNQVLQRLVVLVDEQGTILERNFL
jgi:hypothetical protein